MTLLWTPVHDLQDPSTLNRRLSSLVSGLDRHAPKHVCEFWQDNVAASQAAVGLAGGGSSIAARLMPTAGHVVGLAVYSNAARTAGTLTVAVTVNGTALTKTVTLDGTNTTSAVKTIDKNLASYFAVASLIGATVTTDGAWTPTTADILVAVLVEYPMEAPSL